MSLHGKSLKNTKVSSLKLVQTNFPYVVCLWHFPFPKSLRAIHVYREPVGGWGGGDYAESWGMPKATFGNS